MKVYDISNKISNELPSLKITDDFFVTINNRKSTVLNIRAMTAEKDRKVEDINKRLNAGEKVSDEELASIQDEAYIEKALKMLIGESSAEKLESMDLPLSSYMEVYSAVMSIATGTYEDDTPSK